MDPVDVDVTRLPVALRGVLALITAAVAVLTTVLLVGVVFACLLPWKEEVDAALLNMALFGSMPVAAVAGVSLARRVRRAQVEALLRSLDETPATRGQLGSDGGVVTVPVAPGSAHHQR